MKQSLLFRAFDLLFALTGILITLPIMIVITLIGFFDTGSPIFLQRRVGRHLEEFVLVKFRTMRKETPSLGTHMVDSSSMTPLGSFLRKTKLDELPQLFNVLLGQMSLVGPRPCLPNQTALIKEREKRKVYEVRPGITGLAQVKDVDMSTPKKLAQYDAIMIRDLNFGLYLRLILETALGKGNGDRVR